MKYDWKKEEKALYAPKGKVQYGVVDKQTFITIKGEGNPNETDYANRIQALYAVAYGIKMAPKSGVVINGYYDYSVYPLEGIWCTKDADDLLDKSQFMYTMMIRQPSFVSRAVFETVVEKVKKKKKLNLLDEVKLEVIEDGAMVQILHIGTYDDEPRSFALMNAYMEEHDLKRCSFKHREIYLSDPRRTVPEKLKTILRYSVCHK